jgi:exodeoxyribonuclease V alpha subunit
VIVTLPRPPSPVLSRELVYTAVTRAKEQVTLVAAEESLRAAISRPVARASGLQEKLWPEAPRLTRT